jgi:hypothetical protein
MDDRTAFLAQPDRVPSPQATGFLMKCSQWGEWTDCRDLAEVIRHAMLLPHPRDHCEQEGAPPTPG